MSLPLIPFSRTFILVLVAGNKLAGRPAQMTGPESKLRQPTNMFTILRTGSRVGSKVLVAALAARVPTLSAQAPPRSFLSGQHPS
jgi:hypothetical protein